MTDTTVHRALSLAAGAVAGIAVWWFVRDPALAAAVGLSALVSALLWARISRDYATRFEGESWRDRQWVAVGTAVVYLVAYNGTLLVPLSLEYRIGLQALVLGAGTVGYAVGTLTEAERESRPDSLDAADDRVPGDD